jgi:predicted negative regulator of RcsB-dependent stress response
VTEGRELDELLTDEQQAEKVRNWLRENGVFIAAGVVLGLGGLFGWQEWRGYTTGVSGDASIVWEQMRSAIDGERFNEAIETLELLESDYSTTPYVDQARLAMARMHMTRNSVAEALEQLTLVIRSSRDPQIRRVAELRAAQIYLYQEDYAAALKILGASDTTAFASLYHDLRGDIYHAQGSYEDAAAEYQLALDTDTANAIDRTFLQIKLDDVSGSIAAAPEIEISEVLAEPATANGE